MPEIFAWLHQISDRISKIDKPTHQERKTKMFLSGRCHTRNVALTRVARARRQTWCSISAWKSPHEFWRPSTLL